MKILIVDDELLIQFGLEKTFQDLGEVKTVDSGEKACDAIHSDDYDLCFLDICLPGINGLQVFDVIQRNSPRTKVVIMTAHADEHIRERMKNKALLFLEKPFKLAEIKQLIKETFV